MGIRGGAPAAFSKNHSAEAAEIVGKRIDVYSGIRTGNLHVYATVSQTMGSCFPSACISDAFDLWAIFAVYAAFVRRMSCSSSFALERLCGRLAASLRALRVSAVTIRFLSRREA